ncbi:MAG TPA: flagellar hook-basal body complex protein, partial [Planctomycetota bacterium]|nr:flagellar hook-basal body complex protein [Planctomycetota bacterium]
WRVYTEAADSKQLSGAGVLLGTQRATGSGQLLFSTEGQFLSQTGTPGVGFVTINLPNQGAITPLTFTPDFSDVTGFGNTQSIVFMRSQDGLPTGILTDFQVDQDGVVKGIFTNGATRDLAQIMVARFPNPNGLEEDGANNFRVATNSGTPVISAPGQQSAGLIVGGALEASNVDFAKEFSDLIVAQRAFQANARVITRSDQMLETLVNIV